MYCRGVECPKFGYPAQTSDIYLSSKNIKFCADKISLKQLKINGKSYNCFSIRMAILFVS